MIIQRLPALADNYIFVLEDVESRTAAVVDPAEAEPVLEYVRSRGLRITHILNTHHHGDHVGGNRKILSVFPEAQVFAGEHDKGRIPGQTHTLVDGDKVTFAGRTARVFFTPGHTRGHICYYFASEKDGERGELFCGDTIFGAGCGKLFEGTFAQMHASLQALRQLPETTRIWCAHEYTLENLQIAVQLEPHNHLLQERMHVVEKLRSQDIPTIPLSFAEEKSTSPFFRWDDPSLQQHLGTSGNELLTFTRVREFRDRF